MNFKIKKQSLVPNLIYTAFSIIIILQYLAFITITTGNILLVLLGSSSIAYCFFIRRYKISFFLLFIMIYTFLGFTSFYYNNNADFIELFWPLGFMSIGSLLIFAKLSPKCTWTFYWIFALSVLFAISIQGGITSFTANSSRNSISIYALMFFSTHMITAYRNKTSVNFIAVFPILIPSFIALGRSGVLTSLLLLLFFILIDFNEGKASFKNIKLFLIECFIILLFFLLPESFGLPIIDDVIVEFSRRGVQSSRKEIWTDYIAKAFSSPANILFGAKISGTPALNFYSTNLHNSFLMLHAKFGLYGILLVLILLFKTVICFIREKNMYLLVPLLAVIFRMNFDYTNFNAPLDVVMIFYILYLFYRRYP